MGNNLKTFEEYKYFKFGKTGTDSEEVEYDNVKDPNEPFSIFKKGEYKTKERKQKLLDQFNLTIEEWNDFIKKLEERELYPSDLEPKGNPIICYELWLYNKFTGDNIIYFFPNEKIVTVETDDKTIKNKKKIFKYDQKPDLNEILEYLYTIKEDPKEYRKKRDIENNRVFNKKYQDLMMDDTDNPVKTSHHSEDTSTFDSYKYKRKINK